MRRATLAAAALGALVGAAQAEPHLSFVFDEAAYVFVPQMDGSRTGFSRFASVDAVSIEGADGPARLVLELALPPGSRTGDRPHDARISFRPDGWRDYWVSPPDFPPGAVQIDHLDLAGLAPRIAGRFDVALCFTRSPLRPPDPARCLVATGRFDTPLVAD